MKRFLSTSQRLHLESLVGDEQAPLDERVAALRQLHQRSEDPVSGEIKCTCGDLSASYSAASTSDVEMLRSTVDSHIDKVFVEFITRAAALQARVDIAPLGVLIGVATARQALHALKLVDDPDPDSELATWELEMSIRVRDERVDELRSP